MSKINVDKSELQDFIEYLEGEDDLIEKYWTSDSWNNYVNALNKAKNILDNPNATKQDFDDSLISLSSAAADLVVIGNKYDTSKLEYLLNKAKEYFIDTNFPQCENNDWTECYLSLNNILNEALNILDNPNATQEEIDNALKGLVTAEYDLKMIGKVFSEIDICYKQIL